MTTLTAQPFTLEQILADAGDLAALPQVVMRVIEISNDPGASAADLERVIATDPALAAKILTLANSAYFGMPRRLSSLREAVVFLGFKSVRTLALSVTSFALFMGKSDADALIRRSVWRHSLDTAQCARTLTTLLPPSVHESFGAEEAFTAGLLHDIGKMALDHSRHSLYVSLAAQAERENVRYFEVEARTLPLEHGMIGAAMAQQWNLPPPLCEAIAFHHTPRAAQINPRLTATISLANEIAHALAQDHAADPDCLALRIGAAQVLPPLRLSGDSLPSFMAACRSELVKGWSQMCLG